MQIAEKRKEAHYFCGQNGGHKNYVLRFLGYLLILLTQSNKLIFSLEGAVKEGTLKRQLC